MKFDPKFKIDAMKLDELPPGFTFAPEQVEAAIKAMTKSVMLPSGIAVPYGSDCLWGHSPLAGSCPNTWGGSWSNATSTTSPGPMSADEMMKLQADWKAKYEGTKSESVEMLEMLDFPVQHSFLPMMAPLDVAFGDLVANLLEDARAAHWRKSRAFRRHVNYAEWLDADVGELDFKRLD